MSCFLLMFKEEQSLRREEAARGGKSVCCTMADADVISDKDVRFSTRSNKQPSAAGNVGVIVRCADLGVRCYQPFVSSRIALSCRTASARLISSARGGLVDVVSVGDA